MRAQRDSCDPFQCSAVARPAVVWCRLGVDAPPPDANPPTVPREEQTPPRGTDKPKAQGAILHLPAVVWAVGVLAAGAGGIWSVASAHVKLDRIEERINQRAEMTERVLSERIDGKFAGVETRFASVERRLDRIENRLWPTGAGVDAGAQDAAGTPGSAAIENEVLRLRGRYPGVAITRTYRAGVWGYWVEFADGSVFRVRLGSDGVFHWYTPVDEPATPR